MPFEDMIPDAPGRSRERPAGKATAPSRQGVEKQTAGPIATPFITLQKVSERLGLSEAHLRREIRLRKLACHRFGRLVRISEADLAAYLLARRQGVR